MWRFESSEVREREWRFESSEVQKFEIPEVRERVKVRKYGGERERGGSKVPKFKSSKFRRRERESVEVSDTKTRPPQDTHKTK